MVPEPKLCLGAKPQSTYHFYNLQFLELTNAAQQSGEDGTFSSGQTAHRHCGCCHKLYNWCKGFLLHRTEGRIPPCCLIEGCCVIDIFWMINASSGMARDLQTAEFSLDQLNRSGGNLLLSFPFLKYHLFLESSHLQPLKWKIFTSGIILGHSSQCYGLLGPITSSGNTHICAMQLLLHKSVGLRPPAPCAFVLTYCNVYTWLIFRLHSFLVFCVDQGTHLNNIFFRQC